MDSESGEHISDSNKNEEYSRRIPVAQSGTKYTTISTDQGHQSIETRKGYSLLFLSSTYSMLNCSFIHVLTSQNDFLTFCWIDSNGNGSNSQDNLCMTGHCLPPTDIENLSATTLELQKLNLDDRHSAIIPEHIRVCEADCHMLSFGSFNGDFRNLSAGFITEEAIRFPVSECVTEEGSLVSSDSTALRLVIILKSS
jgi:hypothetical protein